MIINWVHLYKKYKGLWVALKDDEKTVISYGKTIKDVMDKAKKKGAVLPILFRVPTRATAYIGIVFHEISL